MTPPVLVYAAGFGTRMRPLTDRRPKPLVGVAGRSLLHRTLDLIAPEQRVVINTHYLATQIHEAPFDREVSFSHEPEILETGGGLKAAAPMLDASVVQTLNSDAIWTDSRVLSFLNRAWDGARMDALLLLIPKARARGYQGAGDFHMAMDGTLSRGTGDVFTGAQMIKPELATARPEAKFSTNVIWDDLIARGRLCGVICPGLWCDVGHPGAIPLAEGLLRDG